MRRTYFRHDHLPPLHHYHWFTRLCRDEERSGRTVLYRRHNSGRAAGEDCLEYRVSAFGTPRLDVDEVEWDLMTFLW
jgi:hypothetical protein